jgi:hypothetical protein
MMTISTTANKKKHHLQQLCSNLKGQQGAVQLPSQIYEVAGMSVVVEAGLQLVQTNRQLKQRQWYQASHGAYGQYVANIALIKISLLVRLTQSGYRSCEKTRQKNLEHGHEFKTCMTCSKS